MGGRVGSWLGGRQDDGPGGRQDDGPGGARGGRRRRRATVAVAVLAAAGAVAALRAGAEPVPPRADTAEAPAPRPRAEYRVLPPPPYDRLPGRTPIPAPQPVGPDWDIVRGRLPAVGGPGRPAAQRAAELVIGRYCREPSVLAAEVTPDRGWVWVTARVFSMERSNNPLVVTFRLIWTRRSYDWTGSHPELLSC